MRRLLITIVLIFAGFLVSRAQTSMDKPNLSVPSLVAPGYFGPNAFPVPDMSDGTVSRSVRAELYGEGFLCTMTKSLTDDVTADLFARPTPVCQHKKPVLIARRSLVFASADV